MAGDPSNVGGAPVSVFVFQVKDQLGCEVGSDGISRGGVDHAFGFAGSAGSIENVQRMFGVERIGGTNVGSVHHQLVPPVIAAFLQVDFGSGTLVDDHMLYAGT